LGLRSDSTSAYSDARQRLPWRFLLQALQLQAHQISRLSPLALWKGWLVALLDGSTVRLRYYGDIPSQFPPHANQYRQRTYWCLMRVAVSFCYWSGAALDCALGSHYLSEQALGANIILGALGPMLFVGDRNFGIFRIAQAARAKGHTVLLRLTEARAAKLLARALRPGDHRVSWKPTAHDQLQPELSAESLPGRLLVVELKRRGFRSQRLCLFTTLLDSIQFPAQDLVELYGLRWRIELNLRYVKAQMQSAQLEAHSADMARKEWLASLLAYNLIRAAMLCAALQKGIAPCTLSFSACRRRLEHWLRDFGHTKAKATAGWVRTLAQLAHCHLPKRRRARPSEPRAKRRPPQSFPSLIGSRAQARKRSKNVP
jgi:hypothetical protein